MNTMLLLLVLGHTALSYYVIGVGLLLKLVHRLGRIAARPSPVVRLHPGDSARTPLSADRAAGARAPWPQRGAARSCLTGCSPA